MGVGLSKTQKVRLPFEAWRQTHTLGQLGVAVVHGALEFVARIDKPDLLETTPLGQEWEIHFTADLTPEQAATGPHEPEKRITVERRAAKIIEQATAMKIPGIETPEFHRGLVWKLAGAHEILCKVAPQVAQVQPIQTLRFTDWPMSTNWVSTWLSYEPIPFLKCIEIPARFQGQFITRDRGPGTRSTYELADELGIELKFYGERWPGTREANWDERGTPVPLRDMGSVAMQGLLMDQAARSLGIPPGIVGTPPTPPH